MDEADITITMERPMLESGMKIDSGDEEKKLGRTEQNILDCFKMERNMDRAL